MVSRANQPTPSTKIIDIRFGLPSVAAIAILALAMNTAGARSGGKHSGSYAGNGSGTEGIRNMSKRQATGQHMYKPTKKKFSAPPSPTGPLPIPYPNQNLK